MGEAVAAAARALPRTRPRAGRLSLQEALGRPGAHRGGGHRAQGDAGLLASLAGGIQGEARRHAHDGDLHGLAAPGLEEGGGGAGRRRRHAHPCEQLAGPAGRLVRPEQELLEGQLAGPVGAEQGDRRVQHEQARAEVGGGGGVHQVAADGGHVAHLVAADHLGPLDEPAQGAREGGGPLDGAMGDGRPQRDAAVGLDAGEAGDVLQGDHVARRHAPAFDLHEEIGAAGQEAPLLTEAGGEAHRLLHAGRLVIVEAAHAPGHPRNSSQVSSQAWVVSASDSTSMRSSLPWKRPAIASAGNARENRPKP